MPAPICIKFREQKEETRHFKMHIVILKLFHFNLFNFSNKSDKVV